VNPVPPVKLIVGLTSVVPSSVPQEVRNGIEAIKTIANRKLSFFIFLVFGLYALRLKMGAAIVFVHNFSR
jgi:hypothetical protein